jgi:hypothetical protein
MKTRTPYVIAPDPDQLFTLPLTFAGGTVSTIKRKQGRSWAVFQAFMTLLLTRRQRTADVDHRPAQNPAFPNGAVLCGRYVSPG